MLDRLKMCVDRSFIYLIPPFYLLSIFYYADTRHKGLTTQNINALLTLTLLGNVQSR